MNKFIPVICLLLLSACGAASGEFSDNVPTGSAPFLSRAVPEPMSFGDSVTIFGYGFSIVPEENLVILGDLEIPAEDYELVDPAFAQTGEIESITFTVPLDASLGVQTLTVTVLDNDSSNSLNITLQP